MTRESGSLSQSQTFKWRTCEHCIQSDDLCTWKNCEAIYKKRQEPKDEWWHSDWNKKARERECEEPKKEYSDEKGKGKSKSKASADKDGSCHAKGKGKAEPEAKGKSQEVESPSWDDGGEHTDQWHSPQKWTPQKWSEEDWDHYCEQNWERWG